MYYVYLLRSRKDQKFYIGFTSDLKRRFAEHNNGESQSTRSRIPFDLIYYEAYKSKADAMTRERKLKGFKNSYKELIKRVANSIKIN